MTDLLSSFQKGVTDELQSIQKIGSDVAHGDAGAAFHDAGSGVTRVGRDALSAGQAIADAFAGPLRGSSVHNGQIVGPLGQKFGADPVQFCMNGVRFGHAKIVDLVNRTSERAGKTSIKVKDQTGKAHTVPTIATTASSVPNLAASLVVLCAKHPAVVADEMQRIMIGAPKGKGLDGFIGVRHLFGIDDAILIGAIVSIVIGIAPIVIGAIVSIAGPALDKVTGKDKPAPPPTILGIDQNVALVGGGIVLAAVLLYAFVHHKKGAGAGASAAG